MELIDAKTILSSYTDKGWFGAHYNMNLYKGCPHGCIYCFSRNECYQIQNFDQVRAKKDALQILERELKTKRRHGAVITGSMSDPYNPCEAEYRLSRGALSLFDRYQYGVVILTKSNLVLRDLDLLCRIKAHSPVAVNFTITCADDQLARLIEPNVCSSSDRFAAIKTLSEAGVNCGVLLMPVLPFVNDTPENIAGLVEKAAAAGAKWIEAGRAFEVTMRANQRQYFYDRADEPVFFPVLGKPISVRLAGNMPVSAPTTGPSKKFSAPPATVTIFCTEVKLWPVSFTSLTRSNSSLFLANRLIRPKQMAVYLQGYFFVGRVKKSMIDTWFYLMGKASDDSSPKACQDV